MKLEEIRPETEIFEEFTARLSEAGLPVEDLFAEPARFYALDRTGDSAKAFGGLVPLGNDALLRSVVVLPGSRGQGLGRVIADALSQEARQLGADRLWLLTTDADAFFAREGWRTEQRADAPVAITGSRQFASTCPASAVLMCKPLV